ncbi:hypothetical protein F7725_004563 [Dissostichus mawsoni]|uniref:ZP domain-containing protein n=1 Tax=Dissostichus mawsoni TaxID=36200 RepID=A0A7J5XKI7_DISMA|nr:hypothetical protein F7725_004563 [Dissostichus mawsoni]
MVFSTVCSTDGRMTVVADLALAIPNGGNPARTNLRDKYCGPKETDGSRALFSFSINSCGSALNSENVTYQNEIFYSKKFLRPGKVVSDNATESVPILCLVSIDSSQCTDLSPMQLESAASSIPHILQQNPTIQPTSALTTTLATTTRLLPQDELQYHTSLPSTLLLAMSKSATILADKSSCCPNLKEV